MLTCIFEGFVDRVEKFRLQRPEFYTHTPFPHHNSHDSEGQAKDQFWYFKKVSQNQGAITGSNWILIYFNSKAMPWTFQLLHRSLFNDDFKVEGTAVSDTK